MIQYIREKAPETASQADYVCYCHETVEPSRTMVPALKMKKLLGMHRTVPFSIGHQGSLSPVSAMEMSHALLAAGDSKRLLLTVADSTLLPFSRIRPVSYVLGDALAIMWLGTAEGKYQVKHYAYATLNIERSWKQPWDSESIREAEIRCIQSLEKLLQTIKHPVDGVILPHLSTCFLMEAGAMAASYGWPVLARNGWGCINLLGSDPFVTLSGLEQEERTFSGQMLLLIFASVHHGAAILLLRKM